MLQMEVFVQASVLANIWIYCRDAFISLMSVFVQFEFNLGSKSLEENKFTFSFTMVFEARHKLGSSLKVVQVLVWLS